MLSSLRGRFFTLRHNYTNPVTNTRAQNLILMIWAAIVVFAVLFVGQVAAGILRGDAGLAIAPELLVAIAALLGASAMIQSGRLDVAIWSFIGLMLLIFIPTVAITVNPTTPLLLVLPLVAAGVLLGRRSFLLILLLFAVALILRAVNQSQSTGLLRYIPAENALPEFINYVIFLGLSGVFLLLFSGSAERVVAASYADLEQLQTAGKFSATLEDVPDENRILTRLLETIQTELGFTLAQVYLSDGEGQFSRRLRLGLGQSARVALRGGEAAVINEAVRTRKPVMLARKDERTRAEHLVSPSRDGMALALVGDGAVLGVLDVQTESPERLTENTIAALSALAAQAAHEIVQVRRIDELQRTVRDQEAVIDRFRNQMSDFQQQSQLATAATWSRYLQGRGSTGFGFDYEDGMIQPSADLPAPIHEAIQRGEIYIEQQGETQVVNVPISLRNQVLGAFTLNIPTSRPVTARQLEMLRTVSSRLGVALESNRLLEQTQAQALRERRASEIGNLLLSVTEVDSVLNLAAESFNEALGAVHTRVYLDPSVTAQTGDAS